MSEAMIARAEALMAQGRATEALVLTEGLVAEARPTHMALATHAAALKAAGRREEAVAFNLEATKRFADSAVAWHNYAATLGDLGRAAEALTACEAAFKRGLDAPETWSAYARALQASGDLDRAEDAFRQALMRSQGAPVVAAELANLVWMRGGDLAAAQAVLDAAFHQGGNPSALLLAKATLFETAGEGSRAADLLETASRRLPDDLAILLGAAQSSLYLERIAQADRYVTQARALDPDSRAVAQYGAIVDLASGRADSALTRLRAALANRPDDQSLWGWAATAARAMGDPLYAELCDYEAMVGVYDLATPPGWPNLQAFLGDLSKTLNDLHLYQQHPPNQSLRHGSQTLHLLTGSDAPALRAFFAAIDAPIRQHMAKLGQGADPLRRRNTFDYRIQGAWSVRLRAGGFHQDHFHPEGWLSSAFYVETPDAALESADRQGWIRFGQPPFVTDPPLPPAHFVKPKPGRLVLFPSYLWHGTVPFTTDEARLTLAFDAVPK
ncbi:putative 2OG-Fe(II) oxygenase [Phenylobacterium sp.]|uniref:putative 2OG-Fe(II) oxygenase n=1 Tax=Phenylobacterium sp. TaxID=1871053 RepID=UPI00286AC4D3|nr:putative 2OG-Fe(II) oxygenase [Phenylobacterium sp.]